MIYLYKWLAYFKTSQTTGVLLSDLPPGDLPLVRIVRLRTCASNSSLGQKCLTYRGIVCASRNGPCPRPSRSNWGGRLETCFSTFYLRDILMVLCNPVGADYVVLPTETVHFEPALLANDSCNPSTSRDRPIIMAFPSTPWWRVCSHLHAFSLQ